MTPREHEALQKLVGEILQLIKDHSDAEKTSQLVKQLQVKSGLTVEQFGLTCGRVRDVTVYRWFNGTTFPRPANIAVFRDSFDDKLIPDRSAELRRVRIGIPMFWDTSLLSSFELAFGSHNIEPEFFPIKSWHSGAHDMFRNRQIDVAIQNEFIVEFDNQLTPASQLGLELTHPLFCFTGHCIFVHRDRLEHCLNESGSAEIKQFIAGRIDRFTLPSVDGEHDSEFDILYSRL